MQSLNLKLTQYGRRVHLMYISKFFRALQRDQELRSVLKNLHLHSYTWPLHREPCVLSQLFFFFFFFLVCLFVVVFFFLCFVFFLFLFLFLSFQDLQNQMRRSWGLGGVGIYPLPIFDQGVGCVIIPGPNVVHNCFFF